MLATRMNRAEASRTSLASGRNRCKPKDLHRLLTIGVVLAQSVLCLAAEPQDSHAPSATHKEIEAIGATPETSFGNLTTFCMTQEGDLLACDAAARQIRKINPAGKTLSTWTLQFAPYAIHACPDGAVYVAGMGIVAKLNEQGQVLKTILADGVNVPAGKPSGLTATGRDVFLCMGSAGHLRSRSSMVRFDRDLSNPKIIVKDLRGCCQRLDIVVRDGVLYAAENARHRVVKLDRNGATLSKWGQRDRKSIEGFGSCCNPMNLCFGPNGRLYTAEAGLGRVKRYSPDGTFLGLVGYVGTNRFNRATQLAASCSNITVAVSKDTSRVYVLDFKNSLIRVLAKASDAAGTVQAGQ